ncbi:MAG TPA: 6-phosphogluconolactonase [Candidatus Eisenbacteria bacterium]|nr:6-phosphogluconolactonase [Candidatus Eisenbacteria bacterium]
MQIEVYPTDADALDAAAALAAEHVRAAAGDGRAVVALGSGRAGRGLMVALAGRGDLPWSRVEWCLADERCASAQDPLGHAKIARDSLFVPRGVAAAKIHAPSIEGDSPEEIAARYAEALRAVAGDAVAFDLVLLAIGADGSLGALASDAAALTATTPVAVVAGDPALVSLTPVTLARAGRAIVTAVGPQTAGAVARALRDGAGPAALLRPSDRVTWVVDRDAAGELLKDARPADARG